MSPFQVREPGEDPIKKMIVVALTVVFTALYVIAIIGRWRWDSDREAIQLLQPIVYVIIGYFFGRMPSEATERSLRSVAADKTQQASEAQARLKSVRAVLSQTSAAPTAASPAPGRAAEMMPAGAASASHDDLRRSVAAAISVIDEAEAGGR